MSEPVLVRSYLIERAPSRNGPWRYVKSLSRTDIYTAIRAALELRDGSGWLRLLPEARIENVLLIRGDD